MRRAALPVFPALAALFPVVALLAAACGKPAVPPPPAAPNAVTWASCGPTDGPARTFAIADGALSCADQPKLSGLAYLDVELWSGAPLGDVPLALRGTTGAARRCDASGKCSDLEQPTLTFHGDADGSTVGTLRFVEGGVEVVRSFRAVHCDVRVMCG